MSQGDTPKHVIHTHSLPLSRRAVEGTDLLIRKDLIMWSGVASADVGPARVQWCVSRLVQCAVLLCNCTRMPHRILVRQALTLLRVTIFQDQR